jgi:predicted NBD/HSP70 family sugar kinase
MVTRAGATQDEIRRHNLRTLLRTVHESGPITRAELTVRMGLNRSTIKDLVTELSDLGALREDLPVGGRGVAGRPSLVVTPGGDRIQVLAADVGVDRVTVALVGLGGQIVARRYRSLAPAATPDAVAMVIAAMTRSLQQTPAAAEHLLGVGVAVPGAVRRSDGLVRFAPNLGWVDEPFGEALALRLDPLPVWIGNDADLGLLAEHRRGAARDVDDVVFIVGDIGVGGGLVVGGRPLAGAGGYAGELGHMVVHPGGRLCRCGSRGCWETEIGGPAVARALGLPPGATTHDMIATLHQLPPDSAGLATVGHYLGSGLASIVNLVNPQLIVVGGLLREVLLLAEGSVRASLAAAALTAPAEQVEVTVPDLGDDAALIGASELAWTELLDDPVAVLRGRATSQRAASS